MDDITNTPSSSPWHRGELELQRRAGVMERMAVAGARSVRDHLIPQHQQFFPILPFVVVGSVDVEGNAWATMIWGPRGFLDTPDTKTLHVGAVPDAADPAAAGLEDGDAVGILGIQLETRRRNRLNGDVRKRTAGGFDVAVEHSFGNCAKYITVRRQSVAEETSRQAGVGVQISDTLGERAVRMIRASDTLFVATYVDRANGRRQVDVSHRGGKKGFVQVGNDGSITIPDFAGNSFFNTLGNILENPNCGLLFVDFETGDMLHLTGDGEVLFNASELSAFEGAQRLWRFRTRRAILRRAAFPLHFMADAN